MKRFFCGVLALIGLFSTVARAQLQHGDLVAICGDSITEQRMYSEIVETYLVACDQTPNLQTFEFGWGGETSWGFQGRMDNDVLRYKPSVATTCYGMNDGGYGPLSQATADHYRTTQTQIVEAFKKGGVRFIVLGSPGCVDSDTYHGHNVAAALVYNKTLTALRDIDQEVAAKEGVAFADVNTPMNDVMAKAKAKYGADYVFAGPDGVHPGPNGHLVMAYAFLKALGCKGDIGAITIDLAAGKATATAGHEVVAFSNGAATIKSSRYPYCFDAADNSPTSAFTALPLFPFMDDLNRFMLVVPGASGVYEVKFGDQTKKFSGEDLSKGINLASEFLKNPFSEAFAKVRMAVAAQQNFETAMIRQFVTNKKNIVGLVPANEAPFEQIASNLAAYRANLVQASAATVAPVQYVISVTPVK